MFIAGLNSGGNAGCTVDGAASTQECSCTQATVDDYYRSSTTYYNGPTYVWGVSFYGGFVGAYPKSVNRYVRAVRGGL